MTVYRTRTIPVHLQHKDFQLTEDQDYELFAGVGGDVVARLRNDLADRTWKIPTGGRIDGRFSVIRKTGTSATSLVAFGRDTSASWRPWHEKGVLLHARADDPSLYVPTLDRVQQWPDKEGAGSHLNWFASGDAPRYEATGWNGLPAVHTHTFFRASTTNAALVNHCSGNGKAFSIGWTFQGTTVAAADTMWSFGHSTNPSIYGWGTANVSAVLQLKATNTSGGTVIVGTGGSMDTNRHVMLLVKHGNNLSFWVDGVRTLSAIAHKFGNQVFDRFVWGCQLSAGSYAQFGNFRSSELVIWNHALDTGAAQDWYTYASAEWGL